MLSVTCQNIKFNIFSRSYIRPKSKFAIESRGSRTYNNPILDLTISPLALVDQ